MLNLSAYEMMALFYIPISLICWTIDYLSDKQITKDETKIGILQYIHHLIISALNPIPLLFVSKSMLITVLTVITAIGTQIGWLITNDECFYINMMNKLICPEMPRRKFRNTFTSFIKHYIRGDDWAYSKIRTTDGTIDVIVGNTIILLHLIKLIVTI